MDSKINFIEIRSRSTFLRYLTNQQVPLGEIGSSSLDVTQTAGFGRELVA